MEIPTQSVCRDCRGKIDAAADFRREHCIIPARYARLMPTLATASLAMGSVLLTGLPGRGKTASGYARISRYLAGDPRRKVAAYSWPEVVTKIKWGYGHDKDSGAGERIIEALRDADVAMIDDLGAENITAKNADWLRELLFVILDNRWSWERITILTSNRNPAELSATLGERLASRIVGMCELETIGGVDRRMA